MRASWEYFVSWPQTAKDFAQMSQTKLTMPVLSIGGDKSLGEALGQQAKLVATLEEQPKQTTDALVKFL